MSKVQDGYELIEELEELKCQIEGGIDQFREKVQEAEELGFDVFMANLDAYVFEQLKEHIDNGNPYNQSLNSIIENFNRDVDGLDDFGDEDDYEEDV